MSIPLSKKELRQKYRVWNSLFRLFSQQVFPTKSDKSLVPCAGPVSVRKELAQVSAHMLISLELCENVALE